ncbi:MAG: hypothetical protein COA57_04185 [Flavobacteriales bacterium]|nr:MAG: hypothetical protein COA57_04185 [Flavobacteriales bacterium]
MRFAKNHKFWLIALLAITLAVFFPSVYYDFINLDDDWMVVNNPYIKSLSFSGIKDIFSSFYVNNYQPFVFLSYALEHYFFGLDTKVFHFTNVLLHVINALLVFVFVKSVSGKNSIAFITAALFALHPMRVESVVWVTERRDLLYSLFFLLAAIQYVKYLKFEFRIKHYGLSLLFFLFSSLSKGMSVSLFFVVILLDFLFERKFSHKVWVDKIPFFLIALGFGLVVTIAAHDSEQIETYGLYTFFERIQFAAYGFLFYIWKSLFPFVLSVFYPYPFSSGELPYHYLLFLLGCLLLVALVLYSLKFTRKIAFAFGFFAATVVFVLQLLPTHSALVTDHYAYIPSIALFYLVGVGYEVWFGSKNARFRAFSMHAAAVIGLYVLFFSYQTFIRIDVWKNSITFWTDAIEKYPNAHKPWFMRANAKFEAVDFLGAIVDYDKFIKINPGYFDAYNNRGNAKLKVGNYSDALNDFNKAIKLNSNYANSYINRGTASVELRNYGAAIEDFTKAIELSPDNDMAFFNRGNVYAMKNNFQEAEKDFSKAIDVNPDNFSAYMMRANVYLVSNDYGDVISDLTKVLELEPSNAVAFYNRGGAQNALGNRSAACNDWQRALQLGYSKASDRINKNCK